MPQPEDFTNFDHNLITSNERGCDELRMTRGQDPAITIEYQQAAIAMFIAPILIKLRQDTNLSLKRLEDLTGIVGTELQSMELGSKLLDLVVYNRIANAMGYNLIVGVVERIDDSAELAPVEFVELPYFDSTEFSL